MLWYASLCRTISYPIMKFLIVYMIILFSTGTALRCWVGKAQWWSDLLPARLPPPGASLQPRWKDSPPAHLCVAMLLRGLRGFLVCVVCLVLTRIPDKSQKRCSISRQNGLRRRLLGRPGWPRRPALKSPSCMLAILGLPVGPGALKGSPGTVPGGRDGPKRRQERPKITSRAPKSAQRRFRRGLGGHLTQVD